MVSKGRQLPALSDDESDPEPPNKASKSASGKRVSKHLEKIREANKENLAKAKAKVAQLEKKLRQKKAKAGIHESDSNEDSENDIESEEEDGQLGFSSSIKPLAYSNQPLKTPLRRIDLSQLNQPQRQKQIPATSRTATSSLDNVDTTPATGHDNDGAINSDEADDHVEPEPLTPEKSDSHVDGIDWGSTTLQKVTPIQLAGLKLSGAPALSDFTDPIVRALLRTAMREYETLICTKTTFPSLEQQVQMATQCWNHAQDEADVNYELTHRMIRLVKRRGSRIRGDLL
ncbi:hypothetical protein C0991_003717, partial [Blastosporella zonata]